MRHLTVLIFFFLLMSSLRGAQKMYFNQLGYYPHATKIALIPALEERAFAVEQSGRVVFEGALSAASYWKDAGDNYQLADFSDFNTPGTYQLRVGSEVSASFQIAKGVYFEVAKATVKAMYYQRASAELKEDHAGKWARPFGHPDTACAFHASTGRTGEMDSPGGWYDAGDYGKYTIPLAYTVHRLLSLYERYPFIFSDGSLNIPESGNGRNDLLDEVRYGLDWLETMQDADGGAFHKLTGLRFEPKEVMPHNATRKRYIIGKSTAASLNYAAALAHAARIYKDIDPEFSTRILQRAERAWQWAQANPEAHFKNPDDVRTGEYARNAGRDEFMWAAVELYISTGNSLYRDAIYARDLQFSIGEFAGWGNVKMHGLISILANPQSFDDGIFESVQS